MTFVQLIDCKTSRFDEVDRLMDRWVEQTRGKRTATHDLVAENYHDHDPSNEQDTMGMDQLRAVVGMWRGGFDMAFTVEDQISQGDRVATRWTWNATHTGDFMGIPAGGKKVAMTGTTTFRCRDDGKIAEAWWQYDRLGLMAQLGALDALEH